ncbi:MAG TPA: serine/threonine-protein kinase [Blastocatellia bacterium]|nr:serine/threonine-protein kinase [Blastocatellia bacterium]
MDNRNDATPIRIGQRVGPYRIVRELGRGGMGEVYLAYRADGEFRKKVAIKVMHSSLDPHQVARFRQERQILADLDHPNIARLLDGGTTPEGLPYVVMEYIRGDSLRHLLASRKGLLIHEIAEILEQVCAGLHAAHLAGVLHRDIKPENIAVTRSAAGLFVKILDFGIAKVLLPRPDDLRTETGIVMGTLAYLSPEQAAGVREDTIDHRSDIYSLGMVAYEMLTGRVAFEGESLLSILYQHAHTPPPPPRRLRPDLDIPEELERVIMKALEKDPAKRQQTALEFAHELSSACSRADVSPGANVLEPETEDREPTVPLPAPAPLPAQAIEPAEGKKVAILSLLSILILLACAAFVIFWLGRARPEVPATAAAEQAAQAQKLMRFRIVKMTGEKKEILPANSPARTGERIRFEIGLLQRGKMYFFYEGKDGSWQWWNPNMRQQPAADRDPPWSGIPERGVDLAPPAGEQKFRIVYVPDGQEWSLESAALPERLLLGDSAGGPVGIPPKAAARILAYLRQEAIQMSAQASRCEDAECQELLHPGPPDRLTHFPFILVQTP